MSKIGIVDVGGGMRAVYAAGVLEYCLDNNIQFDCGIGVSSGSGNLTNFISGQRGNNKKFYTDYSFRKQFASKRNLLLKGCLIDLDYIYKKLINSDGEAPLDYEAFVANPMEFQVVATDAKTGEVRYFDKSDIKKDDYRVLMCSSSIPAISKPCEIDGKWYYDGALSDSIPVDRIFQMGCQKAILLLARPKDELRVVGKDEKLASKIQKKYPDAAAKMRGRADTYNEGMQKARQYEKEGKLLILAPDDCLGVSTVSRDLTALNSLFDKGYKDAELIKDFIK